MENLVLEQGQYFYLAQESVRTGLRCLFGRKFGSLEKVAEALKPILPSVYIPNEIPVQVASLSQQNYRIPSIPVYGLVLDDPEPEEVARVRVI